MELFIKGILKKIKQMEEENLYILMEIIMKETGLIIRLKELADIHVKLGGIIKEDGRRISLKDLESNNGEMETFIKVNLEMG